MVRWRRGAVGVLAAALALGVFPVASGASIPAAPLVTPAAAAAAVVDTNRDGVGDAVVGSSSGSLVVGESSADGVDARIVLGFDVDAAGRDLVLAHGRAVVRLTVRGARGLVARVVVVDVIPSGAAPATGDYAVSGTRVVRLVPAAGQVSIDVTAAVAGMTAAGRLTLRLRLDRPGRSADGRRTTVTIAAPDAPAGAPVLTFDPPVVGAPAPLVDPADGPAAGAPTPPPAVAAGHAWDLVFADEFADPARTATLWRTGMRSGAHTLEGNTELEWYDPRNSVVTTDADGTGSAGVLQQRVTRAPVAGTHYTVRTLCRLLPPARFPNLYDPQRDETCTDANTTPTTVPYQFSSGMLNSAAAFGFRYGYVEARVKLPKGFAFWPALWLRDWQPWSKEIDVMEGFDANARTVRSTYWWGSGQHYGSEQAVDGDTGLALGGGRCHAYAPVPALSATPDRCSVAGSVDLSAGFHTVGLLWTADRYQFLFDGQAVFTSPAGAAVDTAYNHLILDLAFGNDRWEWNWAGGGDPLHANLEDPARFPKPTVEWDYVRVWQLAGAHDVCTTGDCPG